MLSENKQKQKQRPAELLSSKLDPYRPGSSCLFSLQCKQCFLCCILPDICLPLHFTYRLEARNERVSYPGELDAQCQHFRLGSTWPPSTCSGRGHRGLRGLLRAALGLPSCLALFPPLVFLILSSGSLKLRSSHQVPFYFTGKSWRKSRRRLYLLWKLLNKFTPNPSTALSFFFQ